MVIYQLIRGGGDYTYDEYFGLIPPESKTFEFPLYITLPFSSETSTPAYFDYKKDNDDIVKQLYTYCAENAEFDYSAKWYEVWVVRNIPDIYINGKKVKNIEIEVLLSGYFSDIILFLDEMSLEYYCNIREDGYIFVSIYK